uniref:Sodium/calcium exchanger membrane region domain-containing protein n=1 Tax=Timema monikensis TaxID=170555 RepID=A0A7R9E5V0_9NEOP|nr:unnamed protein product [Timema monikensis]
MMALRDVKADTLCTWEHSQHMQHVKKTNISILTIPSSDTYDGTSLAKRESGNSLRVPFVGQFNSIILVVIYTTLLHLLFLGMSDDVAGATFMAAATSSPELFINSVGTFITEGDIGVGTIVGSAVFNILAVPACCGLFAGQVSSRGQLGRFSGERGRVEKNTQWGEG